jgi:hypothetical protein
MKQNEKPFAEETMREVILTPSAAARMFTELGSPKSEGWVRYAAVTGKLPCIVTSTGRRLFRESDVRRFVATAGVKGEGDQPAA